MVHRPSRGAIRHSCFIIRHASSFGAVCTRLVEWARDRGSPPVPRRHPVALVEWARGQAPRRPREFCGRCSRTAPRRPRCRSRCPRAPGEPARTRPPAAVCAALGRDGASWRHDTWRHTSDTTHVLRWLCRPGGMIAVKAPNGQALQVMVPHGARNGQQIQVRALKVRSTPTLQRRDERCC